MKIRKSIKVFAAISVCIMLALVLFLLWDFSGPYDYGGSYSWRPGELWQSVRGIFDFEARRERKNWEALDAYYAKLDGFAKANSDDAEALTGAADIYSGGPDSGKLLVTIRGKWPQYRPATALQAMRELRSFLRTGRVLREFDDMVAKAESAAGADPNGSLTVQYYDAEDFMLRADDPFVRLVDRLGDPNKSPIVVMDVAACRKAIAERVEADADTHVQRLGQLRAQDPNNALYDYLMAVGCLQMRRVDQATTALKAASGKTLNLYGPERGACVDKFAEKAGFSRSQREFAKKMYQEGVADRQVPTITRLLRQVAGEAESRGDTEVARAARDAAQKIVDDSAPQKPAAR